MTTTNFPLGRSFILALVAFTLAGCAAPTKKVGVDPERSVFLFPYGNYVHQVKLSIPANPDPSKRKFEFRGAVKIAEDAIRIVVLSPVGTTLFKISEDRNTGKISVENFVSQLKPYESKLADYYASLRILLTTRRHPEGKGIALDSTGRPLALETLVADRLTKFTFADYDEHQIPTALRVESDSFNVEVKVLGYEL